MWDVEPASAIEGYDQTLGKGPTTSSLFADPETAVQSKCPHYCVLALSSTVGVKLLGSVPQNPHSSFVESIWGSKRSAQSEVSLYLISSLLAFSQ